MATHFCLFSLHHTLSRTQKKGYLKRKLFPPVPKKLPASDPIDGSKCYMPVSCNDAHAIGLSDILWIFWPET